jgi:hypothetical protein
MVISKFNGNNNMKNNSEKYLVLVLLTFESEEAIFRI